MSSPFEEEEDRTTIESGWEDEASTTVEQGDAGEKIRALAEAARRPITNITSTNGNILDEPTVDDQRANAAIAIITPDRAARIVITAGNDAGQELAVHPGKTYTIGRAIDNDVVLTDIAVSRKHFDLRFEDGWVLVDRGSGNGTLVNGAIEDHPFLLASGDAIEIGNTSFRFEFPNGPPRAQPSYRVPVDDEEEPSTVAGKPFRSDDVATPSQMPPPSSRSRPKTSPPPSLPRPRPAQNAPLSYPSHAKPPAPSSTLPMPPMAGARPHMAGPGAPSMLGDSMNPPILANMMPTTIPGHGLPIPPPQFPFGYPSGREMPQQHARNGQAPMLGLHGRDPTALVSPTPYGTPHMPQIVPQHAYSPPQLSRRAKLVMSGAGLTLFAAIATISIIKGSSCGSNTGGVKTTASSTAKAVQPIGKPDPKSEPTRPTAVSTAPEPKKDPPPKLPTLETAPKTELPVPKVTVADPPPKAELPVPKVAVADPPPKTEKDLPPTKAPIVAPPPKKEKDPPTSRITATPPRREKETPPKREKETPPKREKERKEKEKEKEKETPKIAVSDPPTRKETPPKKERGGMPPDAVKEKAAGQYREKSFSAAAATLRSSASSQSVEVAKEFGNLAAIYSELGKAFNMGMAPATPSKEAFFKLRTAKTLDASAGKELTGEINARLAQVAPRAALAFIGGGDFESARDAVRVAEDVGANNSNTKAVRGGLEQQAASLYKQASSEISADPDGAKLKLRQILKIVETKSQWHQKATKLLSGG